MASKVFLSPYRPEHVRQYNRWMKGATMLDPLTLEEEYETQRLWEADVHRRDFIIFDTTLPGGFSAPLGRGGGMAGYTLIFPLKDENWRAAGIEVMIAQTKSRRQGKGSEAAILTMLVGMLELDRNKFVAKVGAKNFAARDLFQKLGFKEESRNDIFKEVLYILEIPDPSAIIKAFLAVLPT